MLVPVPAGGVSAAPDPVQPPPCRRRSSPLLLPPLERRRLSLRRSTHHPVRALPQTLSTNTNLAETVCGTPYYLSPELVWGKPYDAASDVWALGVVAFQLLTLKRPFDGPNLGALVMRIARGQSDADALAGCGHPLGTRPMTSTRPAGIRCTTA